MSDRKRKRSEGGECFLLQTPALSGYPPHLYNLSPNHLNDPVDTPTPATNMDTHTHTPKAMTSLMSAALTRCLVLLYKAVVHQKKALY